MAMIKDRMILGFLGNYERAPTETDASVTRAVGSDKVHRREEEFRVALANYMAGYIADQQRRQIAKTVAGNSYFTVVQRFAGWMRDG